MPVTTIIAETPGQREACFAIRRTVFVQEQGVPLSLEMDAGDASAIHFLMLDDETAQPIATARLLDKGAGVAKIGRVAVLQETRGRGLGLRLMQAVIEVAKRRQFREAILDSQTYAIAFYQRLGFIPEGDEFDEAGIPHYRMRRPL